MVRAPGAHPLRAPLLEREQRPPPASSTRCLLPRTRSPADPPARRGSCRPRARAGTLLPRGEADGNGSGAGSARRILRALRRRRAGTKRRRAGNRRPHRSQTELVLRELQGGYFRGDLGELRVGLERLGTVEGERPRLARLERRAMIAGWSLFTSTGQVLLNVGRALPSSNNGLAVVVEVSIRSARPRRGRGRRRSSDCPRHPGIPAGSPDLEGADLDLRARTPPDPSSPRGSANRTMRKPMKGPSVSHHMLRGRLGSRSYHSGQISWRAAYRSSAAGVFQAPPRRTGTIVGRRVVLQRVLPDVAHQVAGCRTRWASSSR